MPCVYEIVHLELFTWKKALLKMRWAYFTISIPLHYLLIFHAFLGHLQIAELLFSFDMKLLCAFLWAC